MKNFSRLVLFFSILIVAAASAASAYEGKATVECGDLSLYADVADVHIAKDEASIHVEIRAHDNSDALVALDVSFKGHDGHARPRHVANYTVEVQCPGTERRAERPALEGVEDHVDFQVLDIQFGEGGKLEMHIWAREEGQPDLSWNVEVSGSIPSGE